MLKRVPVVKTSRGGLGGQYDKFLLRSVCVFNKSFLKNPRARIRCVQNICSTFSNYENMCAIFPNPKYCFGELAQKRNKKTLFFNVDKCCIFMFSGQKCLQSGYM